MKTSQTNNYSHLGPGDKDFDVLANVAYRAFRKVGLGVDTARAEAESFAYTASELLDGRVEDAR